MYLNKIDNKTVIREFNSIGELTQFITDTPSNGKYDRNLASQDTRNNHWTGTETYDEAFLLLLKGWTCASEKMTHALKTRPQPAPIKRQRSVYSVAGHSASVPRYLQGIPTNMISSVPDRRKQPVVVINRTISYSANWTPEDMLEEGIKALQVVQAIEASNRNVKLNIVWIVEDREFKRGVKVTIKQPGERLNIAKMAFPLAHPSMLRRIFFKYLETEPDMPHKFFGYGRPCGQDCKKIYPQELLIPEKVDVEEIFSKNF